MHWDFRFGGIPRFSRGLRKDSPHISSRCRPTILSKPMSLLEGLIVPPNPNGTAPGQWITGKFEGRERIIILLPGPPHELKALVEAQVVARLRAKLPQAFIATRLLKIAGIGESNCDARVAPIYTTFPDVQTTILAGAGEIQLHLRTSGTSIEAAQERVDTLAEKIEIERGNLVFSDNGDSLEQIVGYYLRDAACDPRRGGECTGGLLAERITSVAGSSRYFLGGAVGIPMN